MDIISMQIANKVLKRMNTEFNGLYDIVVATEGQTEFKTSKPHDIENKGLHVYVNGYHATETLDYTHTDSTTIVFKKGLSKDDVVVLTTQIAGIPKYVNPEYNDSVIRGEIVSLQEKLNAIVAALDDDGDGTIVDTIANIKAEWDSADEGLKTLINGKATTEALEAAKASLQEAQLALEAANQEISNLKITTQSQTELINAQTGLITQQAEKINSQAEQISTQAQQISTQAEQINGQAEQIRLQGEKVDAQSGLITTQSDLITSLSQKVVELDKEVNPIASYFAKFDDETFTVIPAGTNAENDPPYQLMQINYDRLTDLESTKLTIKGVGNLEEDLNKVYHTTDGGTAASTSAMFQWSYRDLSTLDAEGSNLLALERTNDTLLKEGTKLEMVIDFVRKGKTFSITAPYTITADDVANATYNEGGIA